MCIAHECTLAWFVDCFWDLMERLASETETRDVRLNKHYQCYIYRDLQFPLHSKICLRLERESDLTMMEGLQ